VRIAAVSESQNTGLKLPIVDAKDPLCMSSAAAAIKLTMSSTGSSEPHYQSQNASDLH